jgi:hypothetical protein
MIKRLAIAGLIVASPAFGQSVDPLIGTWKLNLEKSTFTGLAPPKSMTATWAGEGHNLAVTAEGMDAQGQPFKVILRHIYDGQPHPVTGSLNFDSNTFHRIGNSINGVRFKNGKVVEIAQGATCSWQHLYGYRRGYQPKRCAVPCR